MNTDTKQSETEGMGAASELSAGLCHTPGPWKVFEHSWSDTSILAEGFDHGICRLDINHATEESQEDDSALMGANARLIAAAPDLMAALKKIASPTQTTGLLWWQIEAREALAKAGATCRSDGRCQYAIDHGAEGLGHCLPGKCVERHNAQGNRTCAASCASSG